MQADAGSGTISKSLLLTAFHPRMDDPSRPEPSLNKSSVSSLTGIVKCCHIPGKSTNFRSTIWTLFFLANSNTSRTFIPSSFQKCFPMTTDIRRYATFASRNFSIVCSTPVRTCSSHT